MKTGPVHHCCLLVCVCLAAVATAQQPPLGLVQWGSQTYTLDRGESMPFRVDWDQIPVRRWVLLVEGDTRRCWLNLRRPYDGSLVYDQRGESRHEVDIPWGVDESLSGLLTAEADGAFAISLWGPPRDGYLQAYSYEVNRALEALERGDRAQARALLTGALLEHPDDTVAEALLLGINAGASPDTATAGPPPPDPDALRHLEAVRLYAEDLRQRGEYIAALDTLQRTVSQDLGAEGVALIYADLTALYVDMDNPVQARAALVAAESLGLAPETVERLRQLVDEASR